MVASDTKKKVIKFTIPDFVNPTINNIDPSSSFYDISGERVKITFEFIKNDDAKPYYFEGGCRWTHHTKLDLLFVNSLEVQFYFSDSVIENINYLKEDLITKIHQTIVHELSHGHDKFNPKETSERGTSQSSHPTIKFIHYYIKPTEIRSHMNEVFKLQSAKKYQTAKRIVKRRVKNAVIAQEKSQGNIPYDEQTKDMHRKLFNIMNGRENQKTITEKSIEYLEEILNKTSLRSAPDNLKKFIKEFHISFIKFNNNQDNERYFQKLFPNYNPHNLNQLLEFYEELKTIYRGITKLTNEVRTYIQKLPRGKDYSFLNEMIREINAMNEKSFWGKPIFDEAFKSFNPKLLKKIGKQEIEDFRISHNFMTKSLLKKQQKEWMKNNL